MRSLRCHRVRWSYAVGFTACFTAFAFGQNRWEVVSTDPGASAHVGEQEDTLLQALPWDTDNQDNCGTGGAADTRCEWITEHAGNDVHQRRNGVLAAVLDGSIANQDIVVQDRDFWSDHNAASSMWLVNYDAHFVAVNPADLANLRVIMEFQKSGVTRLTLNLSGQSSNGHFQFRIAPQHSWFDTPETGSSWKVKITLRRLTAGLPAMIWIDNIDVVEAGDLHYHEQFPIADDADDDSDVDLIDFTMFPSCVEGDGVEYANLECHTFDADGDDDVDLKDVAAFQRLFTGPL